MKHLHDRVKVISSYSWTLKSTLCSTTNHLEIDINMNGKEQKKPCKRNPINQVHIIQYNHVGCGDVPLLGNN